MNEISLSNAQLIVQPSPRSRAKRFELSNWRLKFDIRFEVLTEKQKRVLTDLCGLDGRPPRTESEIARELGISRQGVAKHKKLAIAKLKQSLPTEN